MSRKICGRSHLFLPLLGDLVLIIVIGILSVTHFLCVFVFVCSWVFDLMSALACVSACVSHVEMSWMFHF